MSFWDFYLNHLTSKYSEFSPGGNGQVDDRVRVGKTNQVGIGDAEGDDDVHQDGDDDVHYEEFDDDDDDGTNDDGTDDDGTDDDGTNDDGTDDGVDDDKASDENEDEKDDGDEVTLVKMLYKKFMRLSKGTLCKSCREVIQLMYDLRISESFDLPMPGSFDSS